MTGEHLSKQFDSDLDAIRARVLQMGGLVEQQVRNAVDAYANGSAILADGVITGDVQVNKLEVELDHDCAKIIAKRQPAASDLRLVMATVKTITDLERIGDEAAKIARMSKNMQGKAHSNLNRLGGVRTASETAVSMLRRALDCYARLDTAEAARVVRDDEAIDTEFQGIMRQVITFMMEDPRTISAALDVIWIAKALERVGDHAKNIAEAVIYIVKGTDVRHVSVEQLEREALAN